jgi:hypothetical protein
MSDARRSSWARYSLRTPLLATAAVACLLSWRIKQVHHREQLLAELTSRKVIVQTTRLSQGAIYWSDRGRGFSRSILREVFWPARVDVILLDDRHVTNADIDLLGAQFPEAKLHRCTVESDSLLKFTSVLRDPQ